MEQKLGKNSIDIEALRKFVTDYPACLDGRPSQTTIKEHKGSGTQGVWNDSMLQTK